MSVPGFEPGATVLLYLHSPREKVIGVLLALRPAGLLVRGIDLAAFDDFVRQEARGDGPGLALVSLFYPLHRVERVELDESAGGLEGFGDRFRRETGCSLKQAAGFSSRRTRR